MPPATRLGEWWASRANSAAARGGSPAGRVASAAGARARSSDKAIARRRHNPKVKPLVVDLPSTASVEEIKARLVELHEAYRTDYQGYYDRNATATTRRSSHSSSEMAGVDFLLASRSQTKSWLRGNTRPRPRAASVQPNSAP